MRITPETLTTEEIYRLWAAFQTAYRPSTAHSGLGRRHPGHARVHLQPAGPDPNGHRAAAAPPVIDGVSPSNPPPGSMLTITGTNFLGDAAAETLVSFDWRGRASPPTRSRRTWYG